MSAPIPSPDMLAAYRLCICDVARLALVFGLLNGAGACYAYGPSELAG